MKKDCLQHSDPRPVRSNLLLSNCFLQDVIPPKDIHRGNKDHKYFELVREVKPQGVIEIMREMPYPHTVESVKSYAEAADYRNDPASAIYQASKNQRQNLGDIRETQNILGLDSQAARALYVALGKAFKEAQDKVEASKKKEEGSGAGDPPAPQPQGE